MAKSTSFTLKMMNVIFRVIFIGLCIKTGLILYCYFVSIVINPLGAQNLNMGTDLSNLYEYSITHYSMIVFILVILTGLKVCIAYWVVKISSKMKMFNSEGINKMISRISRIAFWAGLVAFVGHTYSEWLMEKNVAVAVDWAYGEILFFTGIIYIIAQVLKKGTGPQIKNELTV